MDSFSFPLQYSVSCVCVFPWTWQSRKILSSFFFSITFSNVLKVFLLWRLKVCRNTLLHTLSPFLWLSHLMEHILKEVCCPNIQYHHHVKAGLGLILRKAKRIFPDRGSRFTPVTSISFFKAKLFPVPPPIISCVLFFCFSQLSPHRPVW